ncbi:hypothetical protein [Edaphobacter sp. 12200R-103]
MALLLTGLGAMGGRIVLGRRRLSREV